MTAEQLKSKVFVCNLVLLGEECKVEHTLAGSVSAFKQFQENIFGKTTREGIILNDPEDGCPKIFFVFNDLYIKTPGSYQFLCTLVEFSEATPMSTSIYSDTFKIDSMMKYKRTGITKTSLLQSFELQGLNLRTRAKERNNIFKLGSISIKALNPRNSVLIRITVSPAAYSILRRLKPNPIPIFEIEYRRPVEKENLQLGADEYLQHILVGSAAAYKRYHENIFGRTTVEGLVLTDPEDGCSKIFFVFSDLYIKTPGDYRFHCQLIDLSDPNVCISTLQTDIFTIHNLNYYTKAKIPDTILTKSFEVQGVDIKNKQKYFV
ncbi:hypothetical protein HDV06_006053 [Boothiomyces sp. JEL0866]|nr:hypothetical protein HDV06_006003 [Boothiomyces sp. JEL0866]KAJ3324795.1 hypothetical protein HDV06_006053 [Boothiomyces sp. JEL0866]